MRIMDLNGMDWFYNDQTGAVAYFSNLRDGAEKRMAKGWQWMGENEMFLKDHDDLLHLDDYLYWHYGGHDEYSFVINSQGKPERIISNVLELDGKEAENFMNDMGYNKEVLEANVYSYDKKWSIPDADGPQWQSNYYEKTEKVFSWVYVKKNSESNYNVLDYYGKQQRHSTSINECSDTWERWERRRYNYTRSFNAGSQSTLFFLKLIKSFQDLYYESKRIK